MHTCSKTLSMNNHCKINNCKTMDTLEWLFVSSGFNSQDRIHASMCLGSQQQVCKAVQAQKPKAHEHMNNTANKCAAILDIVFQHLYTCNNVACQDVMILVWRLHRTPTWTPTQNCKSWHFRPGFDSDLSRLTWDMTEDERWQHQQTSTNESLHTEKQSNKIPLRSFIHSTFAEQVQHTCKTLCSFNHMLWVY